MTDLVEQLLSRLLRLSQFTRNPARRLDVTREVYNMLNLEDRNRIKDHGIMIVIHDSQTADKVYVDKLR